MVNCTKNDQQKSEIFKWVIFDEPWLSKKSSVKYGYIDIK